MPEPDIRPTAEDLSLNLSLLLASCLERIRNRCDDLPLDASATRTVAALCRRLIAREADLAGRDRYESELRHAHDQLQRDFNAACNQIRALQKDLGELRRALLDLAARAEDGYSSADVQAHVADALGITVAALGQEVRS